MLDDSFMREFPIYSRRVQFHETDMAGVVHFSRILTYVEEAEHELMQGMGVPAMNVDGGFPKVRVAVEYSAPLRNGDEFEVKMKLVNIGETSLTWGFGIFVSEGLCVKGKLKTVLIDKSGKSKSIPSGWREVFGGYLTE